MKISLFKTQKATKNLQFLIFLLLIIGVQACKDDNSNKIIPPTESLVSYYNFNFDFKDGSSSNHGLETNVSLVKSDNGNENKFAYFVGTNNYISLSNDFDFNNRTISIWFKALAVDLDLKIIYTSDHPEIAHGLTVFSVKQENNIPILLLNFSNQIHTVPFELNRWYNAVIRTGGLKYSYFLNGEVIKSGNAPSYIASSNGNENAILGAIRTLNSRFFNGYIDNVRIYNRTLTNEEVEIIFNNEILQER